MILTTMRLWWQLYFFQMMYVGMSTSPRNIWIWQYVYILYSSRYYDIQKIYTVAELEGTQAHLPGLWVQSIQPGVSDLTVPTFLHNDNTTTQKGHSRSPGKRNSFAISAFFIGGNGTSKQEVARIQYTHTQGPCLGTCSLCCVDLVKMVQLMRLDLQ